MPAIHFFEEDIRFKLKDKKRIKAWVKNTIVSEGYRLKELNYIFCSDSYLLRINKQYLHHDTLTDIITFDNAETDKDIAGDIFISIDRIRENAATFGTGAAAELHRVIIHGALHLLGYTDKTAAAKKAMTAKEDHYLNTLAGSGDH
jgi:rRNA maturation RNase YbeY